MEAKLSVSVSDLHLDSFRPEGRRGAQPNSLRTATDPDCSKTARMEKRPTSSQSRTSVPLEKCSPKG